MSRVTPWKILHLELSQGIPELLSEPACTVLYVVFYWRGIPLGHQEISSAQLPLSIANLTGLVLRSITPTVKYYFEEQNIESAAIEQSALSFDQQVNLEILQKEIRPLAKLYDCYSNTVNRSVSVVICTRNRPDELARCLRSIQQLSQHPHQILVVDNSPEANATRELVAQFPDVDYVPESRPGLSIARNTGIRHSTSEIIAFTDDDAIVHPDWLKRLQQGFKDSRVMAVTGLILPAELETQAQLIFEKGFGGFSQGYRPIVFDTEFFKRSQNSGVPVWRIGAGANMAIRRQAFDLVGTFDERLGAGASGCSEDSEFWYRLLAEGWFCRYEPMAIVHHYHRQDLESLKQQMYQYMRGHVAALLVQFGKYKHWGNLHRLLITLPTYYLRWLVRSLLGGSRPADIARPLEVLGCLSGVIFYLQHRASNSSSIPTIQMAIDSDIDAHQTVINLQEHDHV